MADEPTVDELIAMFGDLSREHRTLVMVLLWRIERERGEVETSPAFELLRAKDARIADLERNYGDAERKIDGLRAELDRANHNIDALAETFKSEREMRLEREAKRDQARAERDAAYQAIERITAKMQDLSEFTRAVREAQAAIRAGNRPKFPGDWTAPEHVAAWLSSGGSPGAAKAGAATSPAALVKPGEPSGDV